MPAPSAAPATSSSAPTARTSTSPPRTDDAVAVLDRDPGDGQLTQSSGDDGCVSAGGTGECEEGERPRRTDLGRGQPRRRERLRRLEGARRRHRDLRTRPRYGRPQPGPGDGGVRQRRDRRLRQRACPDVGDRNDRGQPRRRGPSTRSPRPATRSRSSTGTRTPGRWNRIAAPDGCIVSKAVGRVRRRDRARRPAGDGLLGRRRRPPTSPRNGATRSSSSTAIATSGKLTQKPGTAGCVSNTGLSDPMQNGTAGECVNGVAMDGISSVAVLPDGSGLYATTKEAAGIVVFERAADGTIAQRPGTAGCTTEAGLEDPGSAVDRRDLRGRPRAAAGQRRRRQRGQPQRLHLGPARGSRQLRRRRPLRSPEPPAAAPPPPPPAVSPGVRRAPGRGHRKSRSD